MGKPKWTDSIRKFIGSLAWKIFLWSIGSTAEEYWTEIWQQEKANNGECDLLRKTLNRVVEYVVHNSIPGIKACPWGQESFTTKKNCYATCPRTEGIEKECWLQYFEQLTFYDIPIKKKVKA